MPYHHRDRDNTIATIVIMLSKSDVLNLYQLLQKQLSIMFLIPFESSFKIFLVFLSTYYFEASVKVLTFDSKRIGVLKVLNV